MSYSTSNRGNKASCSFCEATFSSSTAMMEHLTMCGNKTDPCSNCGRYIRRAVFNYHFENNCADLDDDDDAYNDNDDDDDAYPSYNSLSSNSFNTRQTQTPYIIRCEFCTEDCYQQHYGIHKDYCYDNPRNIIHKDQQQDKTDSKKRPSPVNQPDKDKDDAVRIPCEFCNNLIELSNLMNHQKSCNKTPTNSEKPKPRPVSPSPPGQLICSYCKKQFKTQQTHYIHQTNCRKNAGKNS